MNPTMDKATALHITVYYMLFLRNALRQMDPNIIGQLHQAYQDEWKPYFEKVSVPAEQMVRELSDYRIQKEDTSVQKPKCFSS